MYLKETDKPIVLYGMGNGADKIIRQLELRGIPCRGIFASDGFVRQKLFHGFKVKSYSECAAEFGDMIVLLCFGSALSEVRENILRIARDKELYAPDVPVYGNTLFDLEYAKRNAEGLHRVYSLLADEASKKTFENTVRYKLSGDIKYLIDCEVSGDEPYQNILRLSDSEIYADLGAYRGDTIAEFLRYVKDYSCIYAAEPDPKTFKKLELAVEGMKNIYLYNACISDSSGTRVFDTGGSRGSAVAATGTEIRSVSVDDIFDGKPVTFIKMDIEGQEAAAIKGAFNTIKQQKPKMQISCYHRSEDIIDIPLSVCEIRGDYRIYMRHLPSLPAWDTSYYFV